MKKLLWASLSLAMTIGMVACGDSSSSDSGFSVPEYRNEAALPDSCEMEVAKAGDTYFACFENKWIEVTDSATVEQLKEGLNENEIKEKLEELEDLLKPSAPVKPKSSNSEGSDEDVESSDSEEPESSSDEEECTGRSCKDSSSSGKQQGDDDANKCGGETYDPATQYCQNGTTIADLATCGTAKYNPEERYCTKDGDVANLATCGTVKYNPEEKFCADETYGIVADLCGGQSYHAGEFEVCVNGTVKQYECCGYDGTYVEAYMACIQDVDAGTFEHLYDPTTQYCQNGTTIGNLVSCGTYDPATQFCDSRAPGNIYKYVTIGSQTWMAENLNFEAIEGSYCYDEISANCAAYGRLYTWAAAVGKSEEECGYGKRCNFTDIVQGVCPEGWHLPSDNEWQTLLTAVNSAAKLKANTGWSNDGNGTDDYGFAVKPAGYMSGWYYAGETENASFWTSTADGVTDGYRVLFSYESNDAEVWYKDKGLGYSVRCIKNAN